ncbi:glycoside hydrolase family 3 N-terminal domain-containing protein [uncultured Anaerococcus sp.]|uniref:glycoside hydrolase family 3 protein n=1 Tax=uncultured Anaerococcus sp. TaxID=293428 RepID=UPI00288B3ECA|nr:glycoside hydrolase family 3 N-terminal domain-containing protein [uncultured Anaerococcus sp.]
MKKQVKISLSLMLALGIGLFPTNVSKAKDMNSENVIEENSIADGQQTPLEEITGTQTESNGNSGVLSTENKIDNENNKTEDVSNEDRSSNLEEKSASTPVTDDQNDKEIIDKVSKMTLDEKIGQMMMLEFRNWEDKEGKLKPVTELNQDIKDAIVKYKVGGVILFAENVQTTEQTTKLTHNIQKTAIDNGLDPLLISVDQEGGIVVRLGTGTSLPGNMALGATRDKELAYKYGKIIAQEIKALGINVNLAPVLDTNNNPNNPVIGLRSISSDPKLVGELGAAVIKGLQDEGVSAAVKHFPGHGDTDVDSHLGLPVVNKSPEEVDKLELVPFKKAANDDVDMIMTAHISYPQLEKDTVISKKDGSIVGIPATLSDDIITGIIRNKMHYKGVVITDAMKMKAIADHFGEEEAVIMAIKAGVDIPLMPALIEKRSDLLKLDKIYARIKSEVEAGNIDESQINHSVYRLLHLKKMRNILDKNQYNIPLEDKIEKALAIVGSKEHFDLQREITDKAITVTKNINNALPIYPKAKEKVLIYTPYNNEIPGFEYGFTKLQEENVIDKDAIVDVKSFYEYRKDPQAADEILKQYAKDYDYIIAVSEVGNARHLLKDNWISNIPDRLTTYAKENNKKSAIISISKPYDLDRYKNADAHVLAYGAKGMDPTEKGKDPVKTFGPNIPFSLDIVFGKVKSQGKLPVDVPGLDENYKYNDKIAYKLGYGLETTLRKDEKEIKPEENQNSEVSDGSSNDENLGSNETSIVDKSNNPAKDDEEAKTDTNLKNKDKASLSNANKEEITNKNQGPKTGVSGLGSILGLLASSLAGAFASRKRK